MQGISAGLDMYVNFLISTANAVQSANFSNPSVALQWKNDADPTKICIL